MLQEIISAYHAITALVLWNEQLLLLPIIIGAVGYRLNQTHALFTILGWFALILPFLVSVSAVGAVMEMVDIADDKFFGVVLITTGLVGAGFFGAVMLFGRFVVDCETFDKLARYP